MKKAETVLKTLYYERVRFVSRRELEEVCKRYGIDVKRMIKYFLERGYLIRIFRGIFYLKDPSEIKLKHNVYSSHEMIAEGLKLKGIKRWYFGLYSALKYNHMTHEYFTADFIVNDLIYREKPMKMEGGGRFKFVKLRPTMFKFGINSERTKRNGVPIKYSDKEKTVMDFAYLWKRNGKSLEFIAPRIEEYLDQLDVERLRKYAGYYPKWMEKLVGILGA